MSDADWYAELQERLGPRGRAAVDRAVAAAPALTAQQRDELTVLLRPPTAPIAKPALRRAA